MTYLSAAEGVACNKVHVILLTSKRVPYLAEIDDSETLFFVMSFVCLIARDTHNILVPGKKTTGEAILARYAKTVTICPTRVHHTRNEGAARRHITRAQGAAPICSCRCVLP